MGKKKKPKRPRPLPLDQLSNKVDCFVKGLKKETDRAAALIVGAFLDDALDGMIRAFVLPRKKILDRLLAPSGALSSAAVKTELVYLLGLIDRQEYENLGLIRDIRNRFGHSHECLTFDAPGIRTLCEDLDLSSGWTVPLAAADVGGHGDLAEEWGKEQVDDFVREFSPRDRFIWAATRLAGRMTDIGLRLLHPGLRKRRMAEGPLSVPPTWIIDQE